MTYRTGTYIAAEWEEELEAIARLTAWSRSKHWLLEFKNIHELIQARDSSNPCSIKKSLSERMDLCKTFVLIVGPKTNTARKGSCQYCKNYRSSDSSCSSNQSTNYKSFIEFECDKAVKDGLNIIVLYNYERILRDRCPESVKNRGFHCTMVSNGEWDYSSVLRAFQFYNLV